MKSNFVWCDLSTFDIRTALDFYTKVFRWNYRETSNATMDEAYHVAYQGNSAVSAIFVMPEYLQKINMPSFWMSYISVENIEEVVQNAEENGAIIEIKPTSFDEKSRIALIRDPSGAGFTAYEGKDLKGKSASGHGRMIWNVLHVNDLNLVEKFYKDVFGFKFVREPGSDYRYEIYNSAEELIAHAEILSDDIKGDKQYWMPIFEVDEMKKFSSDIESFGGSAAFMDENYQYAIFTDTQGASFMVSEKGEYIEFY